MTTPLSDLPQLLYATARSVAATGAVGALTVGTLLVVDAPSPSTTDTVSPSYVLADATGHRWHRWPGHPHRRVRSYVIRPGDTATGLAVRFHAWTAELLAINHLTRHSTLYVGQRIRIPVVLRNRHRNSGHGPWQPGAPATRAEVRHEVARAARRHHVGVALALAVAWQESGWRQRRISSAHAIGAMQVLPSSGRWMSDLLGRPLDLYRLRHNAIAGTTLLHVLLQGADRRHALAGYYQGLRSVHRHGMYPSTRRYVANVLALRRMLRHGWNPAER